MNHIIILPFVWLLFVANNRKKALDLLADVTSSANNKWKIRDTKASPETGTVSAELRNCISNTSRLYHIVLNTFIQLRLDILTGTHTYLWLFSYKRVMEFNWGNFVRFVGLCYQNDMLFLLWKYFLSQSNGLKSFYRIVTSSLNCSDRSREIDCQMLLLFSECMIHYIT